MRHALYLAPPSDHRLWQAGCHWLGRDPGAGAPLQPPARPRVQAPWRYGFHATLKAPMALAPGIGLADLLQAARQLAKAHTAFDMPALQVTRLDGFLALCPVQPVAAGHPLRRLADACVQQLDALRAPHDEAERARQLRHARTPSQQANAHRWGYAHVLDDWRCHVTLTDALHDAPADEAAALLQAAQTHFAAALAQPWHCAELCLFTEDTPGAPFTLTHRLPLGAAG